MHKVIQLISKNLYNNIVALSMKIYVHWMNLMTNQIIQKISKSWNFERKGFNAKNSLLKPFGKKIMFNGFKMSSFRCKHVHEIILLKNTFGYPLKLILGFYMFLAINQNIDTQLICMNVKTHHHDMNYLKLDYSNFII
jgi:hypothetical protein